MSDYISFLITLLQDNTKYGLGYSLMRCALRIKRDQIPEDCAEYPMEPESRDVIHALLPEHVRTLGTIVEVEPIFDIHIAEREVE